jgi:two-component system response regulator RegA
MKLLVVEDDDDLREAICESASGWTFQVSRAGQTGAGFSFVTQARSIDEGKERLADNYDLLILDLRLGGENGIALAKHAKGSPTAPAILCISGQATAQEAFQLAALGVRGYLAKPFDMRELRAAIQGVFDTAPDLSDPAMAQVGHRPIHVVQDEVKVAMVKRALALENGNITHAAKRLGVTRAAVQQMIDRYGLPRPSESQGPPSKN